MIEQAVLQRVLHRALRTGGAFAEIFAEDRVSAAAGLDDGRVEQLSSGRDRGAGIRVVVGDTTGFAHTSDLSEQGLLAAAEAASAAARDGRGPVNDVGLVHRRHPSPSTVLVRPESVAKADRVAVLRRADEAARSVSGAISQVAASLGLATRRILVANSDGLFTEDEQVRTNLRVNAVATGDSGMQTGYRSAGSTIGWELLDRIDVDAFAREAAEQAVTKLRARPAPSGELPVVIGAGSGGVLFHEACGHGLEKDLVDKGASVYAGRLGDRVASPLVTLVDDGTVPEEWGASAVDDEGAPSRRNVLIDEGVLTDYMWDFLRNRKEGRPSSGNGRRQSYKHLPMVRMTNTFLENGDASADDVIASTPRGVYVAKLGGGQVNPASGDFVFGMQEAYLIENGEITEPIREGNLIGNGPQCLRDIEVVADDFAFGSPGTCGKDGQGVPVGDGCPTLRVAQLTIGGTAA